MTRNPLVLSALGGLRHDPTGKSVQAARRGLTAVEMIIASGIQAGVATEPRDAIMAFLHVLSLDPDHLARFLAVVA